MDNGFKILKFTVYLLGLLLFIAMVVLVTITVKRAIKLSQDSGEIYCKNDTPITLPGKIRHFTISTHHYHFLVESKEQDPLLVAIDRCSHDTISLQPITEQY